ncbi:MAG: TonB-dependent receptor, partial [Acidiferrobacterales bacterium]|nr:TonB-dependent receptor [Acidiferrobacterales bacterium]
KTKRDVLGTDLAWRLNDQHTLTFGADYYDEEIESTSQYPVSERDNTGAFALLQSSLDRLSFAASLRFDDNSAYGSETNGSIALNYDLSDQIRVTLSYGTAFSAPSFNFLYFPFFGNPDLLPEESTSTELTLRGQHNSLFWRVSGYQTDIENLFSFDPTTFLAANIGKAEIEGIEFELGTQISDWQVSAHLDVLSAQNLITSIELDDRAEQTLSIVSQRSYEKLDLRLAIKAENGRYDNQGTELDGYGVVDVNMQYHFNQQLSLFVSVDNMFDKDYTLNLIGPFERYNTLGRQARISMRYSF